MLENLLSRTSVGFVAQNVEHLSWIGVEAMLCCVIMLPIVLAWLYVPFLDWHGDCQAHNLV